MSKTIPRSAAIALRVVQVASATIVAGIVGYFLNALQGGGDAWPIGRWIYVQVVAGLSIVLGCVLIIPNLHGCFVWPVDIIISLAWFAGFGNLINDLDGILCGQINSIGSVSGTNAICSQWKAGESFAFISAMVWLVTGFWGLFYVWRADQQRLGYWTGRYDV
ncbi:uncharacterized protein TRUGW13939_02484 [Talaromyces rugulosus]|uniref:MARVEL domain-containing protein n=1 Tax=Talaromyces rugulosus TaxID=121627 RepID=A0A7H8QPJ3_TALRU|nr:uncharacterized protein TRUGW13939_02484 [Talaromyces rugulosus]QKX55391.1 hypothetical protein TRUGW13939_02484 [Talaromyces rugulosus]